ncbi:serine hydrolase domain-containing protein [Maribacter aestuarii]|uniref:serine hydrolase domain-containing protein n=1 Tax=Maribacter aestuarii TaxID=1130723 RepID=UPI0025A4E57B|nr:serine hydrolase domain-containing protein [Maribacter aestuarii]
MNKTVLLLFLTFVIISCKQPTEKSNKLKKDFSAVKDTLTTKLEESNKDGEIVGFSVAIIAEDNVIYNKGFGFSDSKNNKEYKTNTIQNIGSIAKTLIGISLLKAQELGKLNLDDPINKHLPFEVINPNYPDVPITIRQLATHTSSIVDDEENYLKAFILENDEVKEEEETAFTHFQKSDKRISLKDFLQACLSQDGKWFTKKMFSENIPGTEFEYTNFGADLCGLVIAEATGMSYKDFTERYILNPLSMNDSGWSIKDVDSLKRSKFYLYKGQKIADYTAITYPNGGLFTSSEDLGKFLSELMKGFDGKGTLLNKKSYTEYFKKQFENPLNESGRINLGLFVEYNNDFVGSNELFIGHNGSDFGSFAIMYFNPETKIGTIVMSNTDIDYKDNVVPVLKNIWKNTLEYKDKMN